MMETRSDMANEKPIGDSPHVRAELLRLNRATFAAEARADGWEQTLATHLSEDFRLRRGRRDAQLEDRVAMTNAIRDDPSPQERIVVGEEQVWSGEDLGVVASVVTLPGRSDNAFHNIKVFTLDNDIWRCRYWQVTPVDRSTLGTPLGSG